MAMQAMQGYARLRRHSCSMEAMQMKQGDLKRDYAELWMDSCAKQCVRILTQVVKQVSALQNTFSDT